MSKDKKQSARAKEAEQIAHNKRNLIEALEKSLGVVTTACKSCNLSRSLFYLYYRQDKDFAAAVDDVENIALDFAESQLHKQIQSGNPTSTIFYLKTKGKNRGYVERNELTGAEGKPLMPQKFIVEVVKNDSDNTTDKSQD